MTPDLLLIQRLWDCLCHCLIITIFANTQNTCVWLYNCPTIIERIKIGAARFWSSCGWEPFSFYLWGVGVQGFESRDNLSLLSLGDVGTDHSDSD